MPVAYSVHLRRHPSEKAPDIRNLVYQALADPDRAAVAGAVVCCHLSCAPQAAVVMAVLAYHQVRNRPEVVAGQGNRNLSHRVAAVEQDVDMAWVAFVVPRLPTVPVVDNPYLPHPEVAVVVTEALPACRFHYCSEELRQGHRSCT